MVSGILGAATGIVTFVWPGVTLSWRSSNALRDTARAGVRAASRMWWWFLILGIVWTALGMYIPSYRVSSLPGMGC